MRFNFLFTYKLFIMMILVIGFNVTTVSAYSIGEYGCEISAIADVVSAYNGCTDPAELNQEIVYVQNGPVSSNSNQYSPTTESSQTEGPGNSGNNDKQVVAGKTSGTSDQPVHHIPTSHNSDTDEDLLNQCDKVIPVYEGNREHVYDDKTSKSVDGGTFQGHPTIGIGFNLDREGAEQDLKDVDKNIDYNKILDGSQSLNEDQIIKLYSNDLSFFLDGSKIQVQNFNDLDKNAKMVVMDMMFNMGEEKFSGFEKMINALEKKDYNAAANEIMDSDYYKNKDDKGNIRPPTKRAMDNLNRMRKAASGK